MSEAAIQKAFTKMFRAYGGDCEGLSFANEGNRGKVQTAQLVAMGLRKGAADWLVFWRIHRTCAVVFIEFKAEKGRVRKEQREFGEAVTKAGAAYVVCRSWKEAWGELQARGAPLARRLEGGRLVLNPKRATNAEGVIQPQTGFDMTPADVKEFNAAMSNPPPPTEAAVRAAQRFRKRVVMNVKRATNAEGAE